MKRIFLKDVFATIEVDEWARVNSARIIRCVPTVNGVIVFYLGSQP